MNRPVCRPDPHPHVDTSQGHGQQGARGDIEALVLAWKRRGGGYIFRDSIIRRSQERGNCEFIVHLSPDSVASSFRSKGLSSSLLQTTRVEYAVNI